MTVAAIVSAAALAIVWRVCLMLERRSDAADQVAALAAKVAEVEEVARDARRTATLNGGGRR